MYETAESFRKKIKNKNKKEKESHGIYKFLFTVLIKCLIVVIMFLGALMYVKKSDNNKEKFKSIVYQNSLSFAKIYSVYKDYLGDVIPFKNIFKDNIKVVSDEKIIYDKIEKEEDGYVLSVASEYATSAIRDGIVVDVKNDNNYKNIIKIQDKEGLNVTYGYLDEIDVKLYDYVDKGELIGKCNKKLFLKFEKDGKNLSYEKYL